MKVLISDYHIGTSSWQKAAIEAAGGEVVVRTLSSHSHYMPGNVRADSLFRNIGNMSREEIEREFNSAYPDVTHCLCSFPPRRVLDLQGLPDRVKIILNIGHRFQIRLSPSDWQGFGERLVELSREGRYRLAVMSEFDREYTRYYTGLELPCLQVANPSLPRPRHWDETKPVLIGPSHNEHRIIGAGSVDDLNRLSEEWAARLGRRAFRFEFIRNLYQDARPELLADHPAVIMIPYSAFSISMVELYQMNVPMFVPSDELLLGQVPDVRLIPFYTEDRAAVDALNLAHSRPGVPPPNLDEPDAERWWMRWMYFNRVRGTLRYSSADDLLRRLYSTDLSAVRLAQAEENDELFALELRNWRELLNS